MIPDYKFFSSKPSVLARFPTATIGNLERTDIGEGTRFLVVSIRQHLLYLTRYLWGTDNL